MVSCGCYCAFDNFFDQSIFHATASFISLIESEVYQHVTIFKPISMTDTTKTLSPTSYNSVNMSYCFCFIDNDHSSSDPLLVQRGITIDWGQKMMNYKVNEGPTEI